MTQRKTYAQAGRANLDMTSVLYNSANYLLEPIIKDIGMFPWWSSRPRVPIGKVETSDGCWVGKSDPFVRWSLL